ncbi:MAG: hypothetical protein I8H91_12805 [Burkholderiales bacterium]|jgi:hypothetical protein|nr:hypothetical protein [Burkholderiales bacterium]
MRLMFQDKQTSERCVEKRAFAIPQIVGYLDALGRAGGYTVQNPVPVAT